MSNVRGNAAIVGTAGSDLGAVAPEMSPIDLMAQGTMRALDDCGLTLGDVDGIFVAAKPIARMAAMSLVEYLGIQPKYFDSTQIGVSFMAHLTHAQALIASGMCETIVVAYGSTQHTVGRATASYGPNARDHTSR